MPEGVARHDAARMQLWRPRKTKPTPRTAAWLAERSRACLTRAPPVRTNPSRHPATSARSFGPCKTYEDRTENEQIVRTFGRNERSHRGGRTMTQRRRETNPLRM